MNKIRVVVNGASGRMGQLICLAIAKDPELELVAKTGRQDDLASVIHQSYAQVVVDVTRAEVAVQNLEIILAAKAHPVIVTSGLSLESIHHFQEQCKQLGLGGIIAPNFSLAAVLTMKYAAEIAKFFPEVEIIEMHHAGKADSPSGTAIRAAELLNQARSPVALHNVAHETIPGSRGAIHCNIPIHAVRLPGLLAHLQIMFGSTGETLTLRHDSTDRQSFMPGICLACKKVPSLNELVYGLENIL